MLAADLSDRHIASHALKYDFKLLLGVRRFLRVLTGFTPWNNVSRIHTKTPSFTPSAVDLRTTRHNYGDRRSIPTSKSFEAVTPRAQQHCTGRYWLISSTD